MAHADADRSGGSICCRRARRHPGLLPLLLVFFLVSTAFSGFEATFALFTERRFGFTAETIGYVFAFIGVILATVNGVLVGRVVPRPRRAAHHSGRARHRSRSACCWCRPPHRADAALPCCGTIALGMGFNNPSLTSAVSRLSDRREQGGMLGLAQSLAALGRIVGPAWGGFLFDRLGSRSPLSSARRRSCRWRCVLAHRRAGRVRAPMRVRPDVRSGGATCPCGPGHSRFMADEVLIYGKDAARIRRRVRRLPSTRHVPFRYINVKKDPLELDRHA